MRMKISLALGPRQNLSRQTAWGCLTTNLAMPGFGSLLAGRVSGYAQAALAVGGLLVTVVFSTRFALWYLANWTRLNDPQAEPFAALEETLLSARWAFLGMAMFAFGWLWALASSLTIVRSAKDSDRTAAPPRLN